MRVLWLCALVACAPKPEVRSYDNSLFELASGFSAKQVCSCLWVAERDEAFCADWTRVSPNVARFRIDEETRTVTSRALGMGTQRARWVDDQVGCTLVAE